VGQVRNALDLLQADERRTTFAAGEASLQKRSSPRDPTRLTLDTFLGTPTHSGARVSEGTAMTLPVVQACVGILSDMIGQLPLKLVRSTAANTREEAKDHPAYRLLVDSPDGHRTPHEFRRYLQTCTGMGGNGFALVKRDSFYRPVELVQLQPYEVSVERLQNRQIVYRVEGERNLLTRADVVHIYGLSLDGFSGISPVRAARESIGLGLIQREQVARMFANGARFPGFLTTEVQRSPGQLKEMKEEWEKYQSGALNAGKTPLFANGWEYKTVQGMTMQDAEFLESRKFERSEIAMMYRVPEVLIGHSEKSSSWGTGIEQLTLGFLKFSLNPWLKAWEGALGLTLLSADERMNGYAFCFDREALLEAALQARAEFFRTMRDIGAYSINDIRRKLGENDLPDAIGDDYSRPFNGSGGTARVDTQTPAANQ
jgi:HK97 family phage portal protein